MFINVNNIDATVLNKWNVSKVKNMASMFENSKFKGDISKWNVSNVKNMKFMFSESPLEKNPPKWWYIYRVKQMKSYLTQKYGAPVVYKHRDKFVKCAPKGILLLEAVWSDASGHATLWDGKKTIDKSDDYFNKPNPTFNLWRLK